MPNPRTGRPHRAIGRRAAATLTVVLMALAVLTALVAACGTAPSGASATPTPAPRATSGATFADAACASLRTLVKAVGNPDTDSGSALTIALDEAIRQQDLARVDDLAEQIAAILADARSYASIAAAWEPGTAAALNIDRLIGAFAAMTEAKRAAAARGLDQASMAGQQALMDAGAMEAWQGLLHGPSLPPEAAQPLANCRFWEGPTPEPGSATQTPATQTPALQTPAPPSPDVAMVLRVDRASDIVGPGGPLSFAIFEDRRLVVPVHSGSGWTERQLTPLAMDALIAAARDSGQLMKDATYPAPDGFDSGYVTWRITLDTGGSAVTVSATNANPGPEARAIAALGDRLIAQVNALTAGSFTGNARPYLPATFDLEILASPGVLATYPSPPTFRLWVEDAHWPLPTPLLETGPVTHDEAGTVTRCIAIDAAAAAAVRASFYVAGYPGVEGVDSFAEYDLGWRTTNGVVSVRVLAVPPGEPADYHCR